MLLLAVVEPFFVVREGVARGLVVVVFVVVPVFFVGVEACFFLAPPAALVLLFLLLPVRVVLPPFFPLPAWVAFRLVIARAMSSCPSS